MAFFQRVAARSGSVRATLETLRRALPPFEILGAGATQRTRTAPEDGEQTCTIVSGREISLVWWRT